MLSMLLAMLETEEGPGKVFELHGTYEKSYTPWQGPLQDGPRQTQCSRLLAALIRQWDRVSSLAWKRDGGCSDRCEERGGGHGAAEGAVGGSSADGPPGTGETDYRYLASLIRALPESYRRVLELKRVEEESGTGRSPGGWAEGVLWPPASAGADHAGGGAGEGRGTSMDERMLRHGPDGVTWAVPGRAGRGGGTGTGPRNRTRLLRILRLGEADGPAVWKRAARTAACVLLACLVTLGGLMASPPSGRRC